MYAISRHRAHALFGAGGCLTIVSGTRLGSGASRGEQKLLYLLIVCPDLQPHRSRARVRDMTYRSRYDYTWSSGSRSTSVCVWWDRSRDRVTVGDQTFDRGLGNAFLIVSRARGDLYVRQVGVLRDDLDFIDSMRAFKTVCYDEAVLENVYLQ